MKKAIQKLLFFLRIFSRRLAEWWDDHATEAVRIVSTIRHVVENTGFENLVEQTRTQVDDRVWEILRTVLPAVAPRLPKSAQEDVDKAVEYVLKSIKSYSHEHRAMFYFKLASFIIRELAKARGDEVSQTEADMLAQSAYLHQKLA